MVVFTRNKCSRFFSFFKARCLFDAYIPPSVMSRSKVFFIIFFRKKSPNRCHYTIDPRLGSCGTTDDDFKILEFSNKSSCQVRSRPWQDQRSDLWHGLLLTWRRRLDSLGQSPTWLGVQSPYPSRTILGVGGWRRSVAEGVGPSRGTLWGREGRASAVRTEWGNASEGWVYSIPYTGYSSIGNAVLQHSL